MPCPRGEADRIKTSAIWELKITKSPILSCAITRQQHRSFLLSTAVAALVYAGPGAFQAHAQSVTDGGDLLYPGAGPSPNWTVGGDLRVGNTNPGQLDVTGGGTVVNDIGYIAYRIGSTGVVTVSGIGASGGASTWTNTKDLVIGQSGAGSLSISSGGSVSNLVGYIGASQGSQGTVIISGRAADGAISTWNNTGNLRVGDKGTGNLTVKDGGALKTGAITHIGYSADGQGTVIVGGQDPSGNASTWVNKADIVVGQAGTGTLTIDSGGLVQVGGNVTIAALNTATGTLNLVETATGRGILEAGSLIKGAGSAVLNLDGGILRATRDESNFLRGFTNLTLAAGGAWFDTNAHDIGIRTAFSGSSNLVKLGLGKLTLTGDSSTFTGTTSVEAGTLAVNGIVGGTMVVLGGRLQGTGKVGSTANFLGGIIAPGNSIGTLTVNGNYTSNGGGLEIEVELGTDNSPTDLLHITGSSLLGTGATQVRVLNVGGAGGVTTGDGIRIVQVDGVSDAGAFAFAGPAIGGAYRYNLFQNDLTAMQDDGNWYLRSAGLAPTVPVYENYPQVLLGMVELPTLQQRVGTRYWAAMGGAEASGSASQSAIWARIEGAHGRFKSSTSTSDARFDSDTALVQVGIEGQLAATASGMLVGGITAQYGRTSADIFSGLGNGANTTTSNGIGATLTWYGENGFYVDGQVQIAMLRSDLSAAGIGIIGDGIHGDGHALSLEAGRKTALGGGWSLTPQAQLAYSSIDFDRFTDRFGANVSLRKGDSLKGRLGVAADYEPDTGTHVYGIANLTYEFLDGTAVAVSGIDLAFTPQRFGGELGAGGTYAWADGKYALRGEVLAATSFAGGYALKGTVGFTAGF